jgi:hypothetical protein
LTTVFWLLFCWAFLAPYLKKLKKPSKKIILILKSYSMETMRISLNLAVKWIDNKKFCTPVEVMHYMDNAINTSDTALVQKFLTIVFNRDDITADSAIAKAYQLRETYQQKVAWKTIFAREDIPLSKVLEVEEKLFTENKTPFISELSEIILLRKDLAPKKAVEKLISGDTSFNTIRGRKDVHEFFETGTTPAEAISYAKKIGDDDLWVKIFSRKDVQNYLKS